MTIVPGYKTNLAILEGIILYDVNKNKKMKTKKVQEQISCSYSYIKVRYNSIISKSQKIFTEENAAQKFVIKIVNEVAAICNNFRNLIEMMPLIIQKQASHNNTINCWICYNLLNENKVRVHCHITGMY